MKSERWQQVEAALHDALLLNGATRAAYLQRIGAADPDLHAELESLLLAQEKAGSLFPAAPASAQPATGCFLGRRLGPYRLIAAIGSGGMGEVYRAVRADREYGQEVAIKLVRGGRNLAFMAQRMRAERQILAGFEHPSIARLLDGGTTDEGIPYLVMELIEGQPITRYCDERGLGVPDRLALFLEVCSAVQYAHQRMVIHRDLKPSNILVTTRGTPKLLDFGIARTLDPAALELPSDATINACRILTPEYASPEQLRGEPVTAAGDVYSLGVILYELLTGTRPCAGTDHPAHDPEPRKPSAAAPTRLARRLRGDLDDIVLMALRREPARRYATVDRLARDIARHLEHLPVTARRPTLRYRASTFITRHGLGVAGAALAALALAGGFALTAWEAHVATVERVRAERRFDDVHTQRAADARRACEAYGQTETPYRPPVGSWAEVAPDGRGARAGLRSCKPSA